MDSNRVKPALLLQSELNESKMSLLPKLIIMQGDTVSFVDFTFLNKLLRHKCCFHSTTRQAWANWWMITEQSPWYVNYWAERFENLHKIDAANPNICEAGKDTHWYTLLSAKPLWYCALCTVHISYAPRPAAQRSCVHQVWTDMLKDLRYAQL